MDAIACAITTSIRWCRTIQIELTPGCGLEIEYGRIATKPESPDIEARTKLASLGPRSSVMDRAAVS